MGEKYTTFSSMREITPSSSYIFCNVKQGRQFMKRVRKTNKMQQSCLLSTLSQHVSGIIMPILRRTNTVCYCMRCAALVLLDVWQPSTTATNHIQKNQRSTPNAVTHGIHSPEDGHNDARNMLRQC